jgi:hypothetical protein
MMLIGEFIVDPSYARRASAAVVKGIFALRAASRGKLRVEKVGLVGGEFLMVE